MQSLGWAAFALVALVACVSMSFAEREGTGEPDEPDAIEFKGTSNKGDLQEAIAAAVSAAEAAAASRGADFMIEYEVHKIQGRRGGFAGFDQITVTIRVPDAPYWHDAKNDGAGKPDREDDR